MTAYHLVYFLTDVRVNGEGSTCSSFQERCLRDGQDCSVIGLAQFSENHVNADMDYQQSITCTIQTGKEIIAKTSITKNALSRCNAQIIPQNKRGIIGVAYRDSKPSDRIIASQLASFRQLIVAM